MQNWKREPPRPPLVRKEGSFWSKTPYLLMWEPAGQRDSLINAKLRMQNAKFRKNRRTTLTVTTTSGEGMGRPDGGGEQLKKQEWKMENERLPESWTDNRLPTTDDQFSSRLDDQAGSF